MMANLCEAAAEAIGANALLARVGCYFHDIGKIAKSEFFTENEAVKMVEKGIAGESAHERLPIQESTRTIMNHVREGVELGRKNKLPEVILDFVPEHHGTAVVYYFYKKALKQTKPGEPPPREDSFRYGGPKPRSKETAITLLADSVEASTRSLTDLSPASLLNNVRKIINEKFIDGQLEECPLTLRDLRSIAESFARTLTGVYHTRIKYPEKDERQEEPKPLTT
jgi:putative nucleotidyltransferase with HDIG domain